MRIRGVVGGSYQAQSPALSVAETMNLIPIPDESKTGVNDAYLLTVPSYRTWATQFDGPIREMFAQNDRCFVIGQSILYEMNSDGYNGFIRGRGLKEHREPPTISSNGTAGNQLFITSGGLGYIYNTSTNTGPTEIADADFPDDAVMGWFSDGYFFTFSRRSRQFQWSDLEDGTAWDAADVGEKQLTTDHIRAGCAVSRAIWLLGSETIEPWYNTGGDPTFAPIPGAIIRAGIHAPFSLRKWGDVALWVGTSASGGLSVMAATSPTSAERVSTHAVDEALASYGRSEEAIAWTYERNGHVFYLLSVPEGGTWVYNLTTKLWHQQGFWNTSTAEYEPDLGSCHAYAFGRHLVGSRFHAALFEQDYLGQFPPAPAGLDTTTYTPRWRRRFPTIVDDASWLFFHRLVLKMQTGVGATTGQGSAPLIMMRHSDDGGRTWSHERHVSLGAIGQYETSVEIRRLGRARNGRVWEISGSDPVIGALVDGYIEATRAA